MSYQTIVVVAATAAAYLHSAVFCDLCPYDPLPTILQPSPRPHSPSFNSKEIVPSRTSKHYSLAAPRRPHPPTPCLLGSNVSSWRLTLTSFFTPHYLTVKKKNGVFILLIQSCVSIVWDQGQFVKEMSLSLGLQSLRGPWKRQRIVKSIILESG